MSEVTEQLIKDAIWNNKQTCLQQHLLQSRLSHHETPSTEIQNNAFSQMTVRNQTFYRPNLPGIMRLMGHN